MGRRRNYSPKVLGYIEKHCGEGSLDWMRGELAERFGIRLDYSQIKNLYANHKFHAKRGAGNRNQRTFPPDVAKYIAENSQGVGSQKMADRLRERFGIECTREKIRYFRKNNRIVSGVDTKFRKGQAAHNKGQAAPLHVRKAMEPTMFKKGNRPHNAQPVGSESKIDGYWKVKIAEPNVWQLKSRYEWERIHGEKLKPSELVLFLDHNPDNFSPDNLVKLTRAELARLNQDQLRGADPDLNMAAVNIARLKTRAKDAEAKRKKGRPKKATVEGLMAKAEQAKQEKGRRPDERPNDIYNDNGGAVHPPGGSRKEGEGGHRISQGKEQSESGHKGREAEIHQREDQGEK